MKVLVATAQTQGKRNNDFNRCVEGELVWVGLICATDRHNPNNGRCGCGRAFAGMSSHAATTTALVKNVALSPVEYVAALRSSLEEQGWPTDDVVEFAGWLADVAAEWPEGTIVERRLDAIAVRARPLPVRRQHAS